MMKRILVPLDGSPLAERALAVAAKLARATNGMLILVQSLAVPVEYGSPFVPQVVPLAIVENERRAQAYLTRQTELPMLSGLSVETCVRSEVPALAILDAATEHRADVIVMTSHGRAGFSRWAFGSVAEHVARQAHIPVLILRQRQMPFWTEGAELVEAPATPGTRPVLPDLHVLVPLDGSPLAETVLDPAVTCAVALVRGVEQATRAERGSIGCHVHLVLVVRPYDTLAENLPEALVITGAEKYLRQVTERLSAAHSDITVSWGVYSAGDVAEALTAIARGATTDGHLELLPVAGEGNEEATSGPCTLLAMATHGRTGVMRWVWGSITERVVQRTQFPLLLVRPSQMGAVSGV